MRRLFGALVLTAFVFGAQLPAQPAVTLSYSVKYGTVNLGTWDHLTTGKSKAGAYDGAAFNISEGPGFATVTVGRATNSADLTGLFPTLKPPNARLTIQTRKGNVVVSTTTCEKANPSELGPNEHNTKIEELTFACVKVVTAPLKPGYG